MFTMATKIQLESLVSKVLELQFSGITVFSVTFDPCFLVINTSGDTISIDTDGKDSIL